jgi:hypothetical protein
MVDDRDGWTNDYRQWRDVQPELGRYSEATRQPHHEAPSSLAVAAGGCPVWGGGRPVLSPREGDSDEYERLNTPVSKGSKGADPEQQVSKLPRFRPRSRNQVLDISWDPGFELHCPSRGKEECDRSPASHRCAALRICLLEVGSESPRNERRWVIRRLAGQHRTGQTHRRNNEAAHCPAGRPLPVIAARHSRLWLRCVGSLTISGLQRRRSNTAHVSLRASQGFPPGQPRPGDMNAARSNAHRPPRQ